MQDLKVSLIQTSLEWNSPQENLGSFSEKISAISGSDLILLPEMFTTGFSVEAEAANLAEEFQENTLEWFKDTAASSNAVIAGSVIWKVGERFFNRLIWMPPSGEVKHYDKRHVFTYAGEDKTFSQGSERAVFELNSWRILPQICYDLRFPVWSRNRNDYDILINTANWPEVRRDAWRTLLKARAIENQCYVIGLNRIGSDPNVSYAGDSLVFDPLGELILDAEDKDEVFTLSLSYQHLVSTREKLPFLKDADSFEVSL